MNKKKFLLLVSIGIQCTLLYAMIAYSFISAEKPVDILIDALLLPKLIIIVTMVFTLAKIQAHDENL